MEETPGSLSSLETRLRPVNRNRDAFFRKSSPILVSSGVSLTGSSTFRKAGDVVDSSVLTLLSRRGHRREFWSYLLLVPTRTAKIGSPMEAEPRQTQQMTRRRQGGCPRARRRGHESNRRRR
eukprot:Gregarina_sp_Poly_1__4571@NODE_2450_length_2120_cov_95_222601_g1554_i0_p1_GENE_NODE_2450_length_2120_cov_95_222601_g1554_i0NODE_2450_length_2120_cov_95_222601_g1554_i0_p1_ORF_typecomplete_len122_score11_87_NODE_2450_length_2120_cov_95_222601_g1554_i012391604